MRYGVTLLGTDTSITPIELARALEDRGFDSLYLPEHSHIPTSRETPMPTGEPEMPEAYKRLLDPFVALAAAAAVTTKLRVGTGICLVAQRDPIATAKAVATLDWLSHGRFTFGIGYGWNVEEMRDHGVAFATRRARAREHVLAMQRLWSGEVAAFDGEFARVPPSWSWPKPAQRPHPPILIGGTASRTLFAHVAEFSDGWMPIGGGGVAKVLPDLLRAWTDAGKDPAKLQVVPFGVVPDAGKLAYYASLPVPEVVFQIPSVPRDAALPILDAYARLIGR